MYLFSRSRVVNGGHVGSAFTFVNEISALASKISGIEIGAWMNAGSPNATTITWTAWFETLADWETAAGKLAADSAYNEALEVADHLFTGALDDQLIRIISPLPTDGAIATYVGGVRAVAAPGHIADAVTHGLEIAAAANEISGLTTIFGVVSTGPYGGLAWFTGAPDIASFEAGQDKINADPKFLALIDSGGAFYAPGADQTLYRRLV